MKSWSDQEEYAGGGEYVTEALQRVRRREKGKGIWKKMYASIRRRRQAARGAGEGTEDWKEKEKQQYLGGLRRLSEKGIAIYVDGRVSGPPEWEKLFEIRDDNMFYMGDYVQAESGGLKEVRFDKVYLSREDLKKPEE